MTQIASENVKSGSFNVSPSKSPLPNIPVDDGIRITLPSTQNPVEIIGVDNAQGDILTPGESRFYVCKNANQLFLKTNSSSQIRYIAY